MDQWSPTPNPPDREGGLNRGVWVGAASALTLRPTGAALATRSLSCLAHSAEGAHGRQRLDEATVQLVDCFTPSVEFNLQKRVTMSL